MAVGVAAASSSGATPFGVAAAAWARARAHRERRENQWRERQDRGKKKKSGEKHTYFCVCAELSRLLSDTGDILLPLLTLIYTNNRAVSVGGIEYLESARHVGRESGNRLKVQRS